MGTRQKNRQNVKYKNKSQHESGCDVYNNMRRTKESTNCALITAIQCYEKMNEDYILKYYNGVFTIKCEDYDLQQLLNWSMYNYFRHGIFGILKLDIDEKPSFYGVNIKVIARKNNNLPKTVSVQYLNKDGVRIPLILSDEFLDWKNINNISIVENWDQLSILEYIRPLLTMSKQLYASLLKRVTFGGVSKIFELDKASFNEMQHSLNSLIFSDSGNVAFMRKSSQGEPWKVYDLGKDDINLITTMLDTNIKVLNLMKQYLGMRYNENFKAERNITLEFEQTNIVFSIFERTIKDTIESWLDDINRKWGINAVLEINTNFHDANNHQIERSD